MAFFLCVIADINYINGKQITKNKKKNNGGNDKNYGFFTLEL